MPQILFTSLSFTFVLTADIAAEKEIYFIPKHAMPCHRQFPRKNMGKMSRVALWPRWQTFISLRWLNTVSALHRICRFSKAVDPWVTKFCQTWVKRIDYRILVVKVACVSSFTGLRRTLLCTAVAWMQEYFTNSVFNQKEVFSFFDFLLKTPAIYLVFHSFSFTLSEIDSSIYISEIII